jgi:hypothetical protein
MRAAAIALPSMSSIAGAGGKFFEKATARATTSN